MSQFISEHLEQGLHQVYTDYTKAFNKVSHAVLLQTLRTEFGFHENLITFFKSYLLQRHQRVVVNGCCSYAFTAVSGVPQGSNLEPLLFLMFINDLAREVNKSTCLMFADDLKLYSVIKSVDDCIALQKDLNNVVKWSETNKISFYVDKCNVMFSRYLPEHLRPIYCEIVRCSREFDDIQCIRRLYRIGSPYT